MNITFMIGNGFDLNLGLETAYRHFLKHYLSHTDGDSPRVSYFKQKISQDWENWSDVELALGQITKDYTGDDAAIAFMECYDDIFDKLAEYLTNEEKRLDEGALDALGKAMAYGLKNWQEGFRPQRKREIDSHIQNFSGGFTYNFIIFNYTRTTDKALSSIEGKTLGRRQHGNTLYENAIGKYIHVHGYTDKDMILGVNDESQIANMKIFEKHSPFEADRLIKPTANLMFENGTDSLAHAILQKSDLVYIYGMSLGMTDQIWWERIEKVLSQKSDMQVIIYSYDAPSDALHYHRFLQHEDRIRSKICDYFDASNLELGERVHVTSNNIFSKLTNIVPKRIKETKQINENNSLSI
ncbi:MAG: bacteriophage abortive infection AbiH family protein [Clostridia bacterium]|nr:bacteriophage abortive infection AbiH family protein [Clostridia bacterium]